jgi:hypothetical protein
MTIRSLMPAAVAVTTAIVARAQSVDSTPSASAAAPVPAAAAAQPPYTAVRAVTPVSAVIEEVIEAVDDGYRFNAYVVRWHGVRVLVSDPAGQGHLAVGDTLHFIAAHSDVMDGHRILNFISLERDAGRGNQARPNAAPSIGQSDTSTVEEVLQAEENGYQYTAYIVRWHGKRVAVIDMLSSQPPRALGDPIDLLVTRMSAMGHPLLGFLKPPTNLDPAAVRSTQDTGIVEEVLRGRVDGATYAEYIVRWQGSQVAVAAEPVPEGTSPPVGVGEGIPLTISRQKLPSSVGVLHIGSRVPVDLPSSNAPGKDLSVSVTDAQGTVERVLTAQADDYRYRAYVVSWQGTLVAVDDAFASTHFNAGDQITFTVARTGPAGSGQLIFTVFDFPCPKGSNKCKAPSAATQ